jgi:diacylglycerol kinase family enzyme
MTLHVLLTVASGGRSVEPIEEVADKIRAIATIAGVAAQVRIVEGNDLAREVRAAASDEASRVAVGGGDGTVSTAAGVMVESRRPLGILPLGTFNHFARDLGIPQDLEASVANVIRGHVREVDVAEVNGHVFVNNSSIGLYPQAVERRDELQAVAGWPKRLSMLYAAMGVVRRFRPTHVTLRTNGAVRHVATPFVFVGNNVFDMSLFSMGTRRALDGGVLSVYLADTRDRFGLLRFIARTLGNRLAQGRQFESCVTDTIDVAALRPTLLVARDGEVTRMRTPLRYRIRPRALQVFAPPEAA